LPPNASVTVAPMPEAIILLPPRRIVDREDRDVLESCLEDRAEARSRVHRPRSAIVVVIEEDHRALGDLARAAHRSSSFSILIDEGRALAATPSRGARRAGAPGLAASLSVTTGTALRPACGYRHGGSR